jgi:hypothetical protein
MYRTLRAARFLVTGPIILAMLFVMNLMTTGHWFKWAALGIGIAWIFSLFRVIRAVVLMGGLLALIAFLKKKQQDRTNRTAAQALGETRELL